eukprot:CAMPEP_0183413978 /NCGR_PEP_ID=MMETSP0370-20130417/22074_1 /TAXON_ID=268820 /ORGANISM="Peridinium aciculiferum, Strain PAER-2" /LENGTH=161 /DNA_ID=CAMNT_0025597249 /DNA_START=104 /DNA_END=589 /DNA_ORIENTATION=-
MQTFFALILAALVCQTESLVVKDPCPFGYGTGCSEVGPISSATKAQVGAILEGILKNLSKDKALVQGQATVSKASSPSVTPSSAAHVEVSAPAAKVLQSLLSSARVEVRQAFGDALALESPSVACSYFGACSASEHPIDSATKAQVASILEGILSSLSKQK